MKTDNQNDPILHETLQAWRITEPLPPRFGERVWQRITRQEQERPENLWELLLSRLVHAFIRPTLAATYVALLLVAGLGAGFWQARVANSHTSEALGARYVHMMDPYQAPRH